MRQRSMFPDPRIRIEPAGDALAVYTPYSPNFVAQLKTRLSPAERKWDNDKRAWLVAPGCGPQVAALIEQWFGTAVDLPTVQPQGSQPSMTILEVRYIGATKLREDGSESAFGWYNGGWNAVFPRSVLMEWFGQDQRPGESPTLYGVLGVSQTASAAELKTAWRRAARQWHPDVCREPDAAEQFQAIQEAWEILSDENRRARYDAGMALEAAWKAQESRNEHVTYMATNYRSPLRCGLILATGRAILGRFVVDRIHQWADIVNSQGKTLVTSWPSGANDFEESWV
jgi:hypothetical protein